MSKGLIFTFIESPNDFVRLCFSLPGAGDDPSVTPFALLNCLSNRRFFADSGIEDTCA